MPWRSGAAFAARHNRKLKGAAAEKARSVAEAMMRRGVPEGEAIATGNKRGNEAMKKPKERTARQKALYPQTDH